MNETTRRVIRTFLQLVAGGGLTALIQQIVKDVPSSYTPYILIVSTLLVTLVQNYLEETGTVPSLMKPPR